MTNEAFSFWISLIAWTGRHWNIMLDIITQSLADLDDPSQPWSRAIITNLKQAVFFAGQTDIEASLRKLQLTDHHIEQYQTLDPSKHEMLYWSAGGLRRILRPVTDPYTYWLATTNAEEREMKRQIKQRHGGNVRSAIDELVRLTGHCHTTPERSAILAPHLRYHLAKVSRNEEKTKQGKACQLTQIV
ncbi:MAG TPA: hypothetical protein VMW38_21770 [Terriglobia bacterium]|nr:hypothetical protein [Terriglobia bacterium]